METDKVERKKVAHIRQPRLVTGGGRSTSRHLFHAGLGDSSAEVDITHSVAGGHDVVVVDILEKRLDLISEVQLENENNQEQEKRL